MIDFTTDKFSGPLGLLLSLIESEELDITEVSLAKIADEYVNYIRKVEDINPEELADFLVVAAKLLFIKSKALLPYLTRNEAEDESDDLAQQLRIYKEFVGASLKIKKLIAEEKYLFIPPLTKNRRLKLNSVDFSPPAKLNSLILQEQFLKILNNLTKRAEAKLPERTLEPKINIEEKITYIKRLLGHKIKFNFSSLLSVSSSKNEVIVSFLAILELIKQRELIFEQVELFSEINILRLL